MPALVFLRRAVGGSGVCVVQTCTDARSASKTHTSARRALPLALIASVCIGETFAAGEVAFIMQLGGLLEELTVAKAFAVYSG